MKFLRVVFVLLLLLALAAGGAFYLVSQPYQGFQKEAFLELSRGTSTSVLAGELASAGVIRAPWMFLAVRALRPSARLQAGEYRFAEPASVWTVFDRIERGDVFYYEVT